jgi:hypothetical protein
MDGAGMFGASHNHVPNTMITNGCERVSLEVDMIIPIYSTVRRTPILGPGNPGNPGNFHLRLKIPRRCM